MKTFRWMWDRIWQKRNFSKFCVLLSNKNYCKMIIELKKIKWEWNKWFKYNNEFDFDWINWENYFLYSQRKID